MGLLDVFRPGSRNPDPVVRLEAIAKLNDESDLLQVAMTDDSSRVRLAAVERIKSDELLARVAKEGEAMDVRLAAVERISSQPLLAEIIKARKNFELMGACFARITDRVVLTQIAEDDGFNPAARRMAVEQFADESYLTDVSGEDEKPSGERKSEAAIDAILATYGDLKVVRALSRFRGSEKALRGLGTIALKGGDVGGLAVEYLCRALRSANPALQQCAAEELGALRDPEMVSVLIRGLDDPKVGAPISDVLRAIGTPQALAALDDDGKGS